MEQIKNNLQEVLNALEDKIDIRQDYWEEKSDKWQDSDAGQKYLSLNEGIYEILDDLDNAVEKLKEIRNL